MPPGETNASALAFLAQIDTLDHVPGPVPDLAEQALRRAWMEAPVDAPAPPGCAPSPAFRAFRRLALCRRLTRKHLLAAHALVCPDLADAGRFRRRGRCRVRCPRTGIELYRAPDSTQVAARVDALLAALDTKRKDPLSPFLALLELVRTHPFADGNGRLGRLLFAAQCWRAGSAEPAYLAALLALFHDQATPLRAASQALDEGQAGLRSARALFDRLLDAHRPNDEPVPAQWSTAVAAKGVRRAAPRSGPTPQPPARLGRVPARPLLAGFIGAALALGSATLTAPIQATTLPTTTCVAGTVFCPADDPWDTERPRWGGDTDYDPWHPDYDDRDPGAPVQQNPGDNQQVRDAGQKSCDEQVGNPVVVTTGNKIEAFTDFASAGEMGLYLRRTYNHYWRYVGLFGQHWVSNFDYSLVPPQLGENVVWAQRPDGRRIRFLWNTSQNRYNEDKAQPIAWIVRHGDDSFTHHTEERTIETYNPFGYVQTVKNRQGIGWTFTYNANNRLQQVTHTSGRSVQFTWTGTRLTQVTDPAGAVFTYTYDEHQFGWGKNRLTSATLPGTPSTTVSYHYENASFPGALSGISYAGGRHSTYLYDALGRAWRTEHAETQHRHSFVYDGTVTPPDNPPFDPPPPGGNCDPNTQLCDLVPVAPEQDIDPDVLAQRTAIAQAARAILSQRVQMNTVVETNPLGKQTEYTFHNGRLHEVIGAASTHCAASYGVRSYDLNGYLQDLGDFNDNTVRYHYNPQGQLLSRVEGFGSADAHTVSYLWDKTQNRLNRITVLNDHRIEFDWRPDHRLGAMTLRNSTIHGAPNQERTTTYAYTLHGNGLVATWTVDGPLPGPGDAVVHTYNAQGDLTQVRNSLNHATNYSQHNGRGQPGRIVGPNGEAVEYLYDGRGRVTRIRTFRNGGQQDTIYTYNAAGLLASVATPDGVTTTFTYDPARRLTQASWNEPEGTVERHLFYDSAGNVFQDEVWRQGQVFWRSYTDYDELNRVRARRGNDGQHVRYEYDPNHNLEKILEVDGRQTVFVYDARNRVIRQTDALNGQTHFAYDAGDRIRQITDPRGRITSYSFDGFGQLWNQTSPDTGTTTQIWSPGGLRTSATRADGVTLTFGHDTLGRPTTVSAGGQTQTTTWDSATGCSHGLGRICRIVDPHQSLVLNYGAYGELTGQTPTIGGQPYGHSFRYDALGRLDRITYPDNVRVDYTWTLGRTTAMIATINGQARTVLDTLHWAYDADEGAHYFERRHGNQQRRRDYHDLDGRLYSINTKLGQGLGYTFDASNRITGLTNFANGLWSQDYGYDALDRLTSATSPSLGSQGFGYDVNGNRTTHSRGGSTATYAISPTSNRLSAITGMNARSYTYKATGQVETISGAMGGNWIFRNGFQTSAPPITTFAYDPFNRLSAITGPGISASYKIAATGMRVEKTTSGQTTRFVYGLGGQLLYERNLSTGQTSQHLYLNGQPVGLVRNGTLHYVLPDHLGRPELIVNHANEPVWRANLTAFERRVIRDQIGGYALGFPGQYHDTETGFAYNVHRDYDPATGRYLQSDPIGLAGGLNTYAYAGNQPTMAIDPLGLACNARGCWNTAEELAFANADNWRGYYAAACAGGDTYACRAGEVAGNTGSGLRGALSAITNRRLAFSIAQNQPGMCPNDERAQDLINKMQAIRIGLMRARVNQLQDAQPSRPRQVRREDIAAFHHNVFGDNGASPSAFGGNTWDSIPGTNWLYDWCPSPACQD